MKNYIFFLQFSNTLNIKYIQFNPQILGLRIPHNISTKIKTLIIFGNKKGIILRYKYLTTNRLIIQNEFILKKSTKYLFYNKKGITFASALRER